MLAFLRSSAMRAAVLLCAGLLAGTWGCRSASGPCPAVTLTVTPSSATIVRGTTRLFTATAKDYKGNVVSTSAAWAVVAGGGTIDASSGVFTAGSVDGAYANTIRATSGGLTAYATVTVITTAGSLASITVTPNRATVVVAGTQPFIATGWDAFDNVVEITPIWSVVAGGGVIDGSGSFTAGGVADTFTNTIRATSGAISGYATVIVNPAALPPSLGAAGAFSVLGGSTVTNTGASTTIVGSVGVSPGTAITGVPAGQPTGGSIHAGDPTAATAQSALTIAYDDLLSRAVHTDMTTQEMGGLTLAPGAYCFNTSAGLTGTLTLDGQGTANPVFVIMIGTTLTTAWNSAVHLTGGALASHVYWQVGSSATLGTGTAFKGSILALESITMNTGATLEGRALARHGAVTLDANTVALP
jgi:hypothetical protein